MNCIYDLFFIDGLFKIVLFSKICIKIEITPNKLIYPGVQKMFLIKNFPRTQFIYQKFPKNSLWEVFKVNNILTLLGVENFPVFQRNLKIKCVFSM